jgi:predicted ArsR family transcriptional regulator
MTNRAAAAEEQQEDLRGPRVLSTMAEAKLLMLPLRMELMRLLAEPRGCTELAQRLGITAQKAHYHVKLLERAGLVEKVAERRVRALTESIYRAAASSYWLSSELTAKLGGARNARGQISLGYMMDLSSELLSDLERLARSKEQQPTLSLSAQVELADAATRQLFMRDLQRAVQRIAEKYGARDADGAEPREVFKLMLACYRQPEVTESAASEN